MNVEGIENRSGYTTIYINAKLPEEIIRQQKWFLDKNKEMTKSKD